MSARSRKYLITAVVVVIILAVLCVLVVPMLVDVDRYRPQVAALLESSTGKPARIGQLHLTIFPHVAIEVDDFALENPKGFPPGDFFKAQRIDALLETGPLWDRQIVIQSLNVKNPAIHLLSNPAGRWNYENPPAPAGKNPGAPQNGGPSFSLGAISQVKIGRASCRERV